MQTKFTSPVKNNSKGNCIKLVNYLEKENELKPELEKERFFSTDRDNCNKWEVIQQIDNNAQGRGLEKNDNRFYSIIIAPSQSELAHIGDDSAKLKEYTRDVMERYAKNFCDKEGVNRGLESKDLVWYAKVESERKYAFDDEKVKAGVVQKGELKAGDQRHIHVIVSSCNARENRQVLKAETKRAEAIELHPKVNNEKVFSRSNFFQKNEQIFDKKFGYKRSREESYEYCNSLKKGDMKRLEELKRNEKTKTIEYDGEKKRQLSMA